MMIGLALTLSLALAAGGALANGHDHQHYEGEEPEGLAEALTLLAERQERLEELLAADALADEAFHEIHEMSYTLENAVERIQGDVDRMAEHVEAIHLGSERLDEDAIREHAGELEALLRELRSE
ncbi:hypothetical protein CCR79_01370 [Halorhodospira halophila]|nr:hypothetical protein [Halorhodospira halophila]